ncbi:MAG TPA: NAD(P)-dependent oxidoreductase [Rhodothermales bacterium]|nr:NAD(P)-dependent oxidoreductase [Rhodothermales bacterium]
MTSPPLPDRIETEADLDEVMTRPTPDLVDFIRQVRSPLVVLGAGGKMGPSLCVQAKRAAEAAGHDLQVVAVSRFTDAAARGWLEDRGVRTASADLLDRDALAGLPDAQDVIYLVGLKFGTSTAPARTWAANTLVPFHVSERYAGARIVALSTGNVYPLVPVAGTGSMESDPLTPLGEYANACVARERLFEYGSERFGTSVVTIRLNYAVDLRYGVLVDIARKVAAGEPVDVTMGYLNCIWQGDANAMIVRALGHVQAPPVALNLTGAELLAVRDLAAALGERLGRPAQIVGVEADTALHSDTTRMQQWLGLPETPLERVLDWTAHWVQHGGRLLGKPTKFEVRDGRY